jgi:hypothetical protein
MFARNWLAWFESSVTVTCQYGPRLERLVMIARSSFALGLISEHDAVLARAPDRVPSLVGGQRAARLAEPPVARRAVRENLVAVGGRQARSADRAHAQSGQGETAETATRMTARRSTSLSQLQSRKTFNRLIGESR